MDQVLPHYVDGGSEEREYRHDLALVARAMADASPAKRGRLVAKLERLPFLRGRNASTGERGWRKPGELYVPDDVVTCFHDGNSGSWFLADESLDHEATWIEVGVRDDLNVERSPGNHQGHVAISDSHFHHSRGLDGFDPNFAIDGLNFALKNPTRERSMLVWGRLIELRAPFHGVVESSSRKDYSTSHRVKDRRPRDSR